MSTELDELLAAAGEVMRRTDPAPDPARIRRAYSHRTTHQCPGPGCHQTVPIHRFACRYCWAMLPRDIRFAITNAYGVDAGAHAAAIARAVDWYAKASK
jgi:hypothetical protein